MIILDKSVYLAKGSERICFVHPNDENKIIKIIYQQKSTNNQNELEYKYYKYLENKKVSFSNLSKCYGFIETNLGEGLVFERIRNYDRSTSLSLREYLQKKIFSCKEEKNLLNKLKNYLEINNILFVDATSVNILVKEVSKTEKKLVIIDGIGAKREGIKFNLYLVFPFYAKYKIKKQWKIFLQNIEKVKRKIKLNQRL